jgi:hypothetical protein
MLPMPTEPAPPNWPTVALGTRKTGLAHDAYSPGLEPEEHKRARFHETMAIEDEHEARRRASDAAPKTGLASGAYSPGLEPGHGKPSDVEAAKAVIANLAPKADKLSPKMRGELDAAYDVLHKEFGVTGQSRAGGFAMPVIPGMPGVMGSEPATRQLVGAAKEGFPAGPSGEETPRDDGNRPATSGAPAVASKAGGGTGPRVVKASWDDSRLGWRPETMNEHRALQVSERDALAHASRVEAENQALVSAQTRADTLAYEEQAKKFESAEAQRQARLHEQETQVKAAEDDYKKAEIDKRSYLERNPASAIAGAIGAAIGGALLARMGQDPSGALRPLENAIERDLSIQKYEIDKKGKNVDAANNIMARMRQIYGDDRAAEIRSRMMLRELAADRIAGIRESNKGQELGVNAEFAEMALRKKNLAEQQMLDRMTYQPAHIVGGVDQQGAGWIKGADRQFVDLGNGKVVRARNADQANDLQKKLEIRRSIGESLIQAVELRKKYEAASITDKPIIRAELEALRGGVLQPIATIKGSGVMSPHEEKNYDAFMGHFDDWTDVTGSKMKNAEKLASSWNAQELNDAAGLEVHEVRLGPNGERIYRDTGTNLKRRGAYINESKPSQK